MSFWELVVTSAPAECEVGARSVLHSPAHTVCSALQSRFRELLARQDVQVCLASGDRAHACGGVWVGAPDAHVVFTFDLTLLHPTGPDGGGGRHRRESGTGCSRTEYQSPESPAAGFAATRIPAREFPVPELPVSELPVSELPVTGSPVSPPAPPG